jgi:hypothetical protein
MNFQTMEGHPDWEIQRIMNERNHRRIDDFDGLSPEQMYLMLNRLFEKDCLIRIRTMKPESYASIPMLSQIRYLAGRIRERGELKLTEKGNLPVKMVADLYAQGFMKDDHVESGITKLYKETDSITINLPRILLELSGVAKKRYNKLSLTKKGEALIDEPAALFAVIFETMCMKFNWGYYDGYSDSHVGRTGVGFTLLLLSRYGGTMRSATFYSDKYFRAFPMLMDSFSPGYRSAEKQASDCYALRTFTRFLKLFGLVQTEQERKWDAELFVTKTALFDDLIGVNENKA